VCSSFEESKPFEGDGRQDVLVVAELSLDRIWVDYLCKSTID